MTYWGDLQCPVCAAFTQSSGFSQVLTNLVRTGKVKIDYRSVETATQDLPTFQTQQAAALAAGKQNRLWNFTELFYRQQQTENSGYVNESFLTGLANQAGLNVSQWKTARSDPSLVSQVNTDISSAQSQQVSSTPTVQFKGPKGSLTVPGGHPDVPADAAGVHQRQLTGAPGPVHVQTAHLGHWYVQLAFAVPALIVIGVHRAGLAAASMA